METLPYEFSNLSLESPAQTGERDGERSADGPTNAAQVEVVGEDVPKDGGGDLEKGDEPGAASHEVVPADAEAEGLADGAIQREATLTSEKNDVASGGSATEPCVKKTLEAEFDKAGSEEADKAPKPVSLRDQAPKDWGSLPTVSREDQGLKPKGRPAKKKEDKKEKDDGKTTGKKTTAKRGKAKKDEDEADKTEEKTTAKRGKAKKDEDEAAKTEEKTTAKRGKAKKDEDEAAKTEEKSSAKRGKAKKDEDEAAKTEEKSTAKRGKAKKDEDEAAKTEEKSSAKRGKAKKDEDEDEAAKTEEKTTAKRGKAKKDEDEAAKTEEKTTAKRGKAKKDEDEAAKTEEKSSAKRGKAKKDEDEAAKTEEKSSAKRGKAKKDEDEAAKTEEKTTAKRGKAKKDEDEAAKTEEKTTAKRGKAEDDMSGKRADKRSKKAKIEEVSEPEPRSPSLPLGTVPLFKILCRNPDQNPPSAGSSRGDWNLCFAVSEHNPMTVYRFNNEAMEFDGVPQDSDYPLIVCKGEIPGEGPAYKKRKVQNKKAEESVSSESESESESECPATKGSVSEAPGKKTYRKSAAAKARHSRKSRAYSKTRKAKIAQGFSPESAKAAAKEVGTFQNHSFVKKKSF